MSTSPVGDETPAVPECYRGVWVRTRLETPEGRDETTFVRWLQTARWHADLRIPADAAPDRCARQQGFCGVTTVETQDGVEVCAWHRRLDFQPPGCHPDAGQMVFDGPDRVIETGIHGRYLEVWERLPGSTGRYAVLERPASERDSVPTWLLVAGRHAMRVRPRAAAWPADTAAGDTLAEVLQRAPQAAAGLLDFEISFGVLEGGVLSIAQSTLPALEGIATACTLERRGEHNAVLQGPGGSSDWHVHEWDPTDGLLA